MRLSIFWLGVVFSAAAPAATPHTGEYPNVPERGRLVALQIVVDGRARPLYAAPDGTPSRYYVEAAKGGEYELQLVNRSSERVGVELSVDGLNVISGERDRPGPDRMYILQPGQSTSIRGWRSSLDEVRRFEFVDEKASYASRAGKANAKMGWIEMAVYREQRPLGWSHTSPSERDEVKSEPEARAKRQGGAADAAAPGAAAAPESSYPGTGWGDRVRDRARLTNFDAEPSPAESLTVRYEYRPALVALGIRFGHDRLGERERGDRGFAKPPRW